MTRFLIQRLALMVLVVAGVTTFLFALSRLSGDPAQIFSPPEASDAVVAATRERLGLDAPLWQQYADAITGAFQFDFGTSFAFRTPAGQLALERLGPSLTVVLPALLLAFLLALAIGTFAALYPTRLRGRVAMAGAFVTDGVPFFLVAFVLVLVFAIWLRWVPATGSTGLISLVIPVAVLTIHAVSTLSRLVRGQLLDALATGPVVTARSKGLPPRTILLQHAFPIALPPVLAWLGIQFSFMFSALLVLEPILNYGGLGGLLVRSVTNRDFPVVQACVFVIAVLITLANIGTDMIVRLLDPRLRAGVSR
ncbi:ABC transporter permease [Actinoplanes derwentensis]|uniref:Peptide/nickel transport system permease protein n=1 Tax=Actinoplanes derwentensis TaxID=113562 RepID=A0A1H1ZTW1_9ACTN|nr:ABC transporter permease [Actinoplanes derwentensis]GID83563.1 glutathione ABC transporter permease [Actinoplanes derwentensis]SDT36832.1 peptide/nickel transport system permease protein [Actinoplanes derwentensis]